MALSNNLGMAIGLGAKPETYANIYERNAARRAAKEEKDALKADQDAKEFANIQRMIKLGNVHRIDSKEEIKDAAETYQALSELRKKDPQNYLNYANDYIIPFFQRSAERVARRENYENFEKQYNQAKSSGVHITKSQQAIYDALQKGESVDALNGIASDAFGTATYNPNTKTIVGNFGNDSDYQKTASGQINDPNNFVNFGFKQGVASGSNGLKFDALSTGVPTTIADAQAAQQQLGLASMPYSVETWAADKIINPTQDDINRFADKADEVAMKMYGKAFNALTPQEKTQAFFENTFEYGKSLQQTKLDFQQSTPKQSSGGGSSSSNQQNNGATAVTITPFKAMPSEGLYVYNGSPVATAIEKQSDGSEISGYTLSGVGKLSVSGQKILLNGKHQEKLPLGGAVEMTPNSIVLAHYRKDASGNIEVITEAMLNSPNFPKKQYPKAYFIEGNVNIGSSSSGVSTTKNAGEGVLVQDSDKATVKDTRTVLVPLTDKALGQLNSVYLKSNTAVERRGLKGIEDQMTGFNRKYIYGGGSTSTTTTSARPQSNANTYTLTSSDLNTKITMGKETKTAKEWMQLGATKKDVYDFIYGKK